MSRISKSIDAAEFGEVEMRRPEVVSGGNGSMHPTDKGIVPNALRHRFDLPSSSLATSTPHQPATAGLAPSLRLKPCQRWYMQE